MTELLSCPFCGKPPAVEMTGFHLGARTIYCADNDCMGPSTTARNMDDATIQWNTRAAHGRCDAVSREVLIHTICPHIKQWSDGEDVVDKACKKCPATVETSHGTGVQMCRLNAEKAADAVLALVPPPSEAGRESQLPKFDYCCHGIERKYCDQCPDALSPDPGTVAVASAQYRCTCGAEPYCAPNVHAASCPLAISSTHRETP